MDRTYAVMWLEFFCSRSPIHRGGVPGKIRLIEQDAKKLEESKKWPGFVREIRHVSFFKGTGKVVEDSIRQQIGDRPRMDLVFAP